MRYIRTEDGIKKVFKKLKDEFYLVKISKYKYYHYYPDCKTADTIEELIDVYILKDTETGYCGVMSKETMKHSINPGTAYGREFYGAIWVIDENGIPTLKPVAKANDKGELELL